MDRITKSVDLLNLPLRQLDKRTVQILHGILELLAPRNRDDVVALGEEPSDGYLCGGCRVGSTDGGQSVGELNDAGKVVDISGDVTSLIAFREVVNGALKG